MLYPDEGAGYERNYVHDAASLVPQVACPHHVDNVHDVTEVEGTLLTQVYIGSCTGGRISDLRTAARVLKNKKVSKGMRCLCRLHPGKCTVWLFRKESWIYWHKPGR